MNSLTGGNCPLGVALPRLLEIKGNNTPTFLESVCSIGPPRDKITDHDDTLGFWLKYFITQLSDGNLIFKMTEKMYGGKNPYNPELLKVIFDKIEKLDPTTDDIKSQVEKLKEDAKSYKLLEGRTIFKRVTPTSDEASKFKIDSIDIKGMMTAIENERLNNNGYFQDILCTASLTASRLSYTQNMHALNMMRNIAPVMQKRGDHEMCFQMAENIVKKLTNHNSYENHPIIDEFISMMTECQEWVII